MALEVFESGSEEQEKKTNKKETKAEIPQEFLQMITDLQKQVEDLKQKGQNPQVVFNGQQVDTRDLRNRLSDTGQFIFDDTTSADDNDMEDVLPQEKWVTFISHRAFNIITSDRRNNRQVPVPFSPIKFKYDSTVSIKNGKETEQLLISSYTCKSKKELEWLRNYTLYGVEIFDSMKGALSEEAKRAKEMSSMMVSLKGMGAADLRVMAGQHPEIEDYHSMTPDQLRFTIASVVTDKRKALEAQLATIRLNETALAAKEIGR